MWFFNQSSLVDSFLKISISSSMDLDLYFFSGAVSSFCFSEETFSFFKTLGCLVFLVFGAETFSFGLSFFSIFFFPVSFFKALGCLVFLVFDAETFSLGNSLNPIY